jgi:hypothetical protein
MVWRFINRYLLLDRLAVISGMLFGIRNGFATVRTTGGVFSLVTLLHFSSELNGWRDVLLRPTQLQPMRDT